MRIQPEEHRWHSNCFPCQHDTGYYGRSACHGECTGKCGGTYEGYKQPDPKCDEPCPCTCRTPLSREEVMRLRALLDQFSKLID